MKIFLFGHLENRRVGKIIPDLIIKKKIDSLKFGEMNIHQCISLSK